MKENASNINIATTEGSTPNLAMKPKSIAVGRIDYRPTGGRVILFKYDGSPVKERNIIKGSLQW